MNVAKCCYRVDYVLLPYLGCNVWYFSLFKHHLKNLIIMQFVSVLHIKVLRTIFYCFETKVTSMLVILVGVSFNGKQLVDCDCINLETCVQNHPNGCCCKYFLEKIRSISEKKYAHDGPNICWYRLDDG